MDPVEKGPMTEAQFIALAGAEPETKENQVPDPARPAVPAKAIEEPKTAEDEEPADAGSADDDEGSIDDEGEDSEREDDAEDDGSPDDADEESDVTAPTKAEQKALDEAFLDALKAEGANPSLEDIPEAARPMVEKKLKNLEAGFTRAMQKIRADERDGITFRAEERFRKDKPVDFIMSMLLEHPEIAEGVNARIDQMEGNATAVEGHKALVEKARREATTAEEGAINQVRAQGERIEQIVTLGRAAARAAGVPFDMGVEEAIAAHVAIKGDISEKEIRAIAMSKAAVYQRQLRQDRRNKSGEYAKSKVADRKAGLRVKPGQGSAPMPGSKRLAKNDQEFIDEFVARG